MTNVIPQPPFNSKSSLKVISVWNGLVWVCNIACAVEGAGVFAQRNNGWHSWSSDLMVIASGETYERSYWILAGRLKWVIWKSHPLSVMLEALAMKTEVIYLLQCDVLQAWRHMKQVLQYEALQPFTLIPSAPDALQDPLSQELQIMPNTRFISHIRHVCVIQTFNCNRRNLFWVHILSHLTITTIRSSQVKLLLLSYVIVFVLHEFKYIANGNSKEGQNKAW